MGKKNKALEKIVVGLEVDIESFKQKLDEAAQYFDKKCSEIEARNNALSKSFMKALKK